MRFFSAAFLSILCGCPASHVSPIPDATAPSDVVRIPVTVRTDGESIVFQSEIADSDQERMRGLMFRRSMGDREGMLFLFPREQQLSFWMRNTLIPLDMLFIKADRTILGIVENAEPQTETRRMVSGDSQFVLEINGGLSSRLGIKAGQTVDFYAPIPSN